MTQPNEAPATPDSPKHYRIRVQEQLDPAWASWFDGLTLTVDDHRRTELAGPVPDQAALYGHISKLRDLGLTLLAVNRVDTK